VAQKTAKSLKASESGQNVRKERAKWFSAVKRHHAMPQGSLRVHEQQAGLHVVSEHEAVENGTGEVAHRVVETGPIDRVRLVSESVAKIFAELRSFNFDSVVG
jgi:hypothetical protein